MLRRYFKDFEECGGAYPGHAWKLAGAAQSRLADAALCRNFASAFASELLNTRPHEAVWRG
jgi:hypothetical protein